MEQLSFYQYMTWLVRQLFDTEGHLLEADQLGVVSLKQLKCNAPEQYELLRQILNYALHGKYFTKAVKGYLLEREYYTQKIYAERIGLKESTFRAQLDRSRKRFFKEFGEDCITELADIYRIQHSESRWLSEERLSKYKNLLLSKLNMMEKLEDSLLIDIRPYAKNTISYMDSEVFKKNCQELHQYSKKEYEQFISRCQENGFFPYINYLINKVYKDDKEMEDFNLIISMLKDRNPLDSEAV